MDKRIENYQHLYLGCDCLMDDGGIGKLVSVGVSQCRIKGRKRFSIVNLPSNIKLILRPLSDMTEEEIIEMAKISDCLPTQWYEYGSFIVNKLGHPNNGIDVCVNRKYSFRVTESAQIYFHDYSKPNLAIYAPNTPQVIIFMLSKGFDLFGLIPAGLAIDKTKLETNG